jgi:hypothetical protein
LARFIRTLGMPIALTVCAVLLLYIARYVGERYGWYYHALSLGLLGTSLAALFRLTLLKLPNEAPDLPPTEDPERMKLQEKIHSLRQDVARSNSAMLRDLVVIPVLACGPAVLVLLIFQQRSYQSDHSIWFRISVIPLFVYFIWRYLIPQRAKKDA